MSMQETVATEALSHEERQEEIRLAAYYLWKENGEQEGNDVENWLKAEAEIEELVEAN
ncbi:MAG TPA: DUF2934 domain-containing protein [Chlorobaculum sp.]|nr:DUF2934 domain-containing protein [Chlorobaculum sp.]